MASSHPYRPATVERLFAPRHAADEARHDDGPTASISAMKMLQGAFFLASRNIADAGSTDTDEHSTKSEPEMVKNGTLASARDPRAQSGS